MEVTYLIVIALVTYVLGSITKLKIDKIPNKFIPNSKRNYRRGFGG